jgi:hypothetical protein
MGGKVCLVSSIEPLTRADLEEIERSSYETDDPFATASYLIDAVVQGRIAAREDIATALLLAAEIYERIGDLEQAEVLAARAVASHRRYGDPDYGFPQAYWAGLLLRLGHAQEAYEELVALRSLLTIDPLAAGYLSEALTSGGRSDLAVQWLTDALAEALATQEQLITHDDADRQPRTSTAWQGSGAGAEAAADRIAFLIYTLAQRRRELRAELGWSRDQYDDLAVGLKSQLGEALDEASADDEEYDSIAVLFWPRTELIQILNWWPALEQTYGATWDDHRARLEHDLGLLWETGRTDLAVLYGNAAELADFVNTHRVTPLDPAVRQAYADAIGFVPGQPDREVSWPPGRNEPCWCGSTQPYRICCRPRSEVDG